LGGQHVSCVAPIDKLNVRFAFQSPIAMAIRPPFAVGPALRLEMIPSIADPLVASQPGLRYSPQSLQDVVVQ